MGIMNTYTGKQFDPLAMAAEDICLEDIAHALSLLCRGGGHLTRFYSVGQHSINCANEARARGWSKRVVLACLLHDASEAYISDIIRPVKMHLTGYYEIEHTMMEVIWETFGLGDLTADEHSKWKQIDDEILDHELKELMRGEKDRETRQLSSRPDFEEKNYHEVEEAFLDMAKELIDQI